MSKKVILLEFNELCPTLLDKFMAKGSLPHFQEMHRRSQVYVTTTSDEQVNPWVQWVTFHTGRPQSDHNINNLDEGQLVKVPALWDSLAKYGLRSFVFGAMNTGPSKNGLITVMPDPWSLKVASNQKDLARLHNVTSKLVQEHAQPTSSIAMTEVAGLATLLLRLGLSLSTIKNGIHQLISEKTSANPKRWKRACIFDQILWDVFETQVRKRSDHLSVFFANSTAHFQHRYWRHMDPDAYEVRPPDSDIARYGDAIEFGYQQMDQMVGRALALGDSDTAVIMASALSQKVNEEFRTTAGQVAYRPIDFVDLLRWAGVTDYVDIAPLMSTTVCVDFADSKSARLAAERLQSVRMNGSKIIHSWIEQDRFYFMCSIKTKVDENAEVVCGISNAARRFHDLYSSIGGTLLDAAHAREGAFWVLDPHRPPTKHASPLPLEDAANIVLSLYECTAAIAAE